MTSNKRYVSRYKRKYKIRWFYWKKSVINSRRKERSVLIIIIIRFISAAYFPYYFCTLFRITVLSDSHFSSTNYSLSFGFFRLFSLLISFWNSFFILCFRFGVNNAFAHFSRIHLMIVVYSNFFSLSSVSSSTTLVVLLCGLRVWIFIYLCQFFAAQQVISDVFLILYANDRALTIANRC